MAASPGSCLGAYKDKSSTESPTSPEAKYCSGHSDSPFPKGNVFAERKQRYNVSLLLSHLQRPLVLRELVQVYKRLLWEQKKKNQQN